MIGRLLRFTVLTGIALLAACATTKVPMDSRFYAGPASTGEVLVIALRGMGGSTADFEQYGFVSALQQRYPKADLVCPDAHFGYYRERSLLPRLYQDFIDPARRNGYQHIYLVGVSLGGLGSLLALSDRPQLFDGVVLLAPYSGEDDLHRAVSDYLSGTGAPPWSTPPSPSDDSLAQLWHWLLDNKSVLQNGQVWLGYGESDRLSGHELLAGLLPVSRVITMEGGHRATVFAQLWQQILDRSPFPAAE